MPARQRAPHVLPWSSLHSLDHQNFACTIVQWRCRFCPFAQRTWIALNEKGIKYSLHEVAIKNPKTGLWHQLDEKPQWFLNLNPLGKVPTLAYKEGETTHSVYESNICNEFLEDYQQEPTLFATHPVAKAWERT